MAAGLRHGPAGVPPAELRRGRADLRQAVLLQGAARVLRPGRRALRLGRAPARAAADARRGRPARRLGHGHRHLPGADVPGAGPRRAAARRHRPGRDAARTTWARAPGPRSPRSPPTGSGLDVDQRRVPRRHVRPAGCRHRRRLRPYRDRRHGASTTPAPTSSPSSRSSPPATSARRCSAPAMPASWRAAAGCIRRDDESRSESYADILAPRRPASRSRAAAAAPRDPAAQSAYAMHAHGAVFAEVKVDPELGQVRVTRLVGAFAAGTRHQPAAGAQPVLRRDDLGRLLRAARARRDRPAHRPRR